MTLNDVPSALSKALMQMPSPAFLRVIAKALGLTVLLTGPFLIVVLFIAGLIDVIPTPSFLGSSSSSSWVGWSSWLFWTYIMSPLAVAIISLLIEPIVEAVEARHYPGLALVKRRKLGDIIGYALRFLGLMLMVSLAAGLVAWLTPIPGWVVFTATSGYLIAREYFETVALRRMPAKEARALVGRNLMPLWLVGIAVAVGLNVPFVNLIAPLVGVAAVTHLYHRV